jgi:hypothetical protein
MHLKAPGSRSRRRAAGFSLLEAVVAAGLLLLTVTAVSMCVTAAVRADARLDRTRDADAALQRRAERLRSLYFCPASLPVQPDDLAAADLCTVAFPHATPWKNTAGARYVDAPGDPAAEPGSFVTVSDEHGVEVRCTAWFRRGAEGPRLTPADLLGWDVETAEEPPGSAMEVVLSARSPGGERTVRLVLAALAPEIAEVPAGDGA